jgi:hypothetical protein
MAAGRPDTEIAELAGRCAVAVPFIKNFEMFTYCFDFLLPLCKHPAS